MPSRVCAISLMVLVAINSCQAMWPLALGMSQRQGGGHGFGSPTLLGAMTGALPCNPMAPQRPMGGGRRGAPGGMSPAGGPGSPGQPGGHNQMGAQQRQSPMFNPLLGAMVDVPDAPDFPMMGAGGLTACYCQNFESSCMMYGMFSDPTCSQFGLCCSCEFWHKR